MLYVISLVLSGALAFAADKDKDVTVNGKLILSEKTKPGDAYVMISGGGGESGMIKPKLDSGDADTKNEAPPTEESFNGYVSIGAASGESHSFSLQLPPGKYTFTAFLKNGGGDGPKCVVVQRGNLPVAVSCFPTKGDTVCSGESFNVGKDSDLELKCGQPMAKGEK